VGQLRTWAPDEQYTIERAHECAQACITSVFRWCAGVWIPSAYLHDLVHPVGAALDTTIQEVIDTFAINETRALARYPTTFDEYQYEIVRGIDADHPFIALRTYGHPGSGIGHFCCITGYDPTNIQLMGPWSGTMFTETWNYSWQMYYGALISVLRKRRLGDH
jgi:hypothetical protein